MTDFRGREVNLAEGTTSQSTRRTSSQERLDHCRREMAQMEERRRIAATNQHQMEDVPSNDQIAERQELLGLMEEVQTKKREIDDSTAYDSKAKNDNFNLRYKTNPLVKSRGWVEVTSNLDVTPEVRKTLTGRKLIVF